MCSGVVVGMLCAISAREWYLTKNLEIAVSFIVRARRSVKVTDMSSKTQIPCSEAVLVGAGFHGVSNVEGESKVCYLAR